MTDNDSASPTVVLVHGAFADAGSLAGPSPNSCRRPASRSRPRPARCAGSPRLRLRRQRLRADSGPGAGRRPLLRRRGDHQRRQHRHQRRRTGLRLRVRPGRERDPRRGRGHVAGQCAGARADAGAVPERAQWGDGDRALREPGGLQRSVRRRPAGGAGRRSSGHPSDRSPRPRSRRSPVSRPGRRCRPGPWSRPATRPPASDVLLSMAKRAGAEILELDGSHVIMISQPQAVTDVILTALRSVG